MPLVTDELDDQPEAVHVGAEGRESALVDLSPGPLDHVSRETFGHEVQGEAPLQIAESLENSIA